VVKTKTIKELSDALNISKVSLYKIIKRDDVREHVFKRGQVTVVSEIGEEIIKNYYSAEQTITLEDVINDDRVNQADNTDLVRILQGQLKEKDNQINSLLNIVTNQQKIQVTQYIADKAMDNSITVPDKEVRQSFFGRMFGSRGR